MPTLPRRSFLLAAAALGAGALTACAGPGSTAQQPGSQPVATGTPEGTVSFAHWRAEDRETFDKLAQAFATATPGVTVTQDITPSNDYQSQALNRLRGGRVGDVFPTFRGAQFEQFVSAGIYLDLSDQELVKNYETSLIEAGNQGGKQWGVPYQVVFNMPVSNLDAFERAGISENPRDWDGFLQLLDRLRAAGLTPMAWPGGDIGNAGQLFNSMVMNNAPSDDACAQIEKGTVKVTDPWFIQTLNQYAELRPHFQPNSTGTGSEAVQQLFASGQAGMLVTGSYHIAAVRALGAQFPVDVLSPITTTAEAAKYEGVHNATFILGLNSASKVQPAALAWLEFLSDPVNAGTYANDTVQHVTVKGVRYENADLNQLAPWLTRKTMLAPRFQFLDLDIRNAVEGATIEVVGGAQPEQAAEKAQRIIDEKI